MFYTKRKIGHLVLKGYYIGYSFFVEIGRRCPIVHISLKDIVLEEDFKLYFGERKLILEDYIVDDGNIYFGNFISYDYGNTNDYDMQKKNADGKKHSVSDICNDCMILINYIDAYNYMKIKDRIKNNTDNMVANINLLQSLENLLYDLKQFAKYTKIDLTLIITHINTMLRLYSYDSSVEHLKEFEEVKKACSNLLNNLMKESEVFL